MCDCDDGLYTFFLKLCQSGCTESVEGHSLSGSLGSFIRTKRRSEISSVSPRAVTGAYNADSKYITELSGRSRLVCLIANGDDV